MTETIYKVGDILEFKSSQYFPARMDSIPGPFRALILRVDDPGYEYATYRLLLFSKECNNFINRYMSALQKDIITSAKRIGHIDISLLRFEEKEQEAPDYAMFFTAATIVQAADLRNELDKIKKENKRLSNENKNLKTMNDELRSSWIECCTSCKQTEENKKVMDENEVLKRENEELRDHNEKLYQALSESKADNAMLKQAEAELEEKTKILDTVYHFDIVCENNKLRNENRILNEIVNDFKSTCDNCEARSENERLRADNEKLRAANTSFSQKIKCAEKYFDSAATALYEGREHLSMAIRGTTGD